jgi:hypothetical protein
MPRGHFAATKLDSSLGLSWSLRVLRALFQDYGHFKQRSIGICIGLPTEFIESRVLEQTVNGGRNFLEAWYDDSVTLLSHPFRVVALLRQRLGIAFYDDGQVEL